MFVSFVKLRSGYVYECRKWGPSLCVPKFACGLSEQHTAGKGRGRDARGMYENMLALLERKVSKNISHCTKPSPHVLR